VAELVVREAGNLWVPRIPFRLQISHFGLSDLGLSDQSFGTPHAYPAAIKDPNLFRAVAWRVNLLGPPDEMQKDDDLLHERSRSPKGEGRQPQSALRAPTCFDVIARASGV
jgi:hypothetical protein